MAVPRLKLRELRKILTSFDVEEDRSRGKGGHTFFFKTFPHGTVGYPVPTKKEVHPAYVSGCRRAFRLTSADGVSDQEFYSRK